MTNITAHIGWKRHGPEETIYLDQTDYIAQRVLKCSGCGSELMPDIICEEDMEIECNICYREYQLQKQTTIIIQK